MTIDSSRCPDALSRTIQFLLSFKRYLPLPTSRGVLLLCSSIGSVVLPTPPASSCFSSCISSCTNARLRSSTNEMIRAKCYRVAAHPKVTLIVYCFFPHPHPGPSHLPPPLFLIITLNLDPHGVPDTKPCFLWPRAPFESSGDVVVLYMRARYCACHRSSCLFSRELFYVLSMSSMLPCVRVVAALDGRVSLIPIQGVPSPAHTTRGDNPDSLLLLMSESIPRSHVPPQSADCHTPFYLGQLLHQSVPTTYAASRWYHLAIQLPPNLGLRGAHAKEITDKGGPDKPSFFFEQQMLVSLACIQSLHLPQSCRFKPTNAYIYFVFLSLFFLFSADCPKPKGCDSSSANR